MKKTKFTALLLSFAMLISLMVPSAFAAESAAKVTASYAKGDVTVEAAGLEKNTDYSRIAVRSETDVLGLGMGRSDADGALKTVIPVGDLKEGSYQVHIYKNSDGSVAGQGMFKVSAKKPGPEGGGVLPGPDVQPGIKDGKYYVDVALWNEYKDQASMGDRAFENNRQVLVTVKNGRVTTVQVGTNPVNMDGIVSAIVRAEIIDKWDENHKVTKSTPVTKLETAKITTKPIGNEYEYIKSFSFKMPDEGQPEALDGETYVRIRFSVPDTPMDSAASAQEGFMHARLKFDWSTAEKTSDDKIEGNIEIGADNEAINLVDKKSGIKLDASTNELSKDATLSVEKVTSGKGYDAAKKALNAVKEPWELYNINTQLKNSAVQPDGNVTVSVPCGDKGLTVYRINDNGTKVVIKGAVKDGFYVFNTSRLGLFAVVGAVEAPAPLNFVDVKGHWAEKDIYFIAERGLFKGTSADKFSPNMGMTRSMFVTVLARLNGADLSGMAAAGFSDVAKDSWYGAAVAWAAANGVVNGVGGTSFAPDRTITRQEMAAILARYCEKFSISLKDGGKVSFSDADKIDGFAKDAVAEITSAGLLKGVGENQFSPKTTASRAEVATLLARFIRDYSL